MTNNFRALCIELTDCLEKADWPNRYKQVFQFWVDIARAALADEPAVPEGREPAAVTGQLSDEELLKLAQQYSIVYLLSDGSACHPFQEGYDMRNDVLNFARAVLARWGTSNLTQARLLPADGEVAELVEWLREQLHACLQAPWTPGIKHFGRAAELLERLIPPQPLPEADE